MKNNIQSLQAAQPLISIAKSKLKELKGGGVIGAAKGKTKVK